MLVSVTPAASWALSPATRTIWNSSRLLAEIDRKRSRSSSGWRSLSASSSTRALKASQDSSRLMKRSGARASIPPEAGTGPFLSAGSISSMAIFGCRRPPWRRSRFLPALTALGRIDKGSRRRGRANRRGARPRCPEPSCCCATPSRAGRMRVSAITTAPCATGAAGGPPGRPPGCGSGDWRAMSSCARPPCARARRSTSFCPFSESPTSASSRRSTARTRSPCWPWAAGSATPPARR